MPKKLQSFVVLKLETARLKEHNYKINITLNQARKNNEVVRLGDSELLRAIRRIRRQEFTPELLNGLMEEKKKLIKRKDTPENRKNVSEITDKIDEILYVKDLLVLSISDVRHYEKINTNASIYINGKRFVRLLCGAGHARRSSVIYVCEEIKAYLTEFLNCGRDMEKEINPNKFNAYYALASSATLQVSRPKFIVVPDCEITKMVDVDYFEANEDDIDPTFSKRTIESKTSLFDGQGLISPSWAEVWMEDLEIDWMPSAFIFRTAFSKGLLVTFDFHSFAYGQGIKTIKDVYGDEHWIDAVDVILSVSQFKMLDFYKNLHEYKNNCKILEYGWGVSRFSPKKDKTYTTTTYQYLQAMNIDDNKIKELSQTTIDWLKNVSGMNWKDALIFLLGEIDSFEPSNFNSFESLVKAILLEPKCLQDAHIKRKMLRLINKKIKESYMGILKIEGNYQFVVSDPWAQCQHIFGLPVTGILQKGKAYSEYWRMKDVKKISCLRSPMTWRSEHVVADVENFKISNFKYQYSNIIFNIHDDWLMRLSGADVDGDIIMTTPQFTDCHYENTSIPYYERKNAPKSKIDETTLWKSDTLSFGSKIGLITNYGTTFFSMLSVYKDEKEQETLINRLKTCNVFQNMQIDKTKGISIYPLPDWWDKFNRVKITSTNEDVERIDLYNKLMCKQRPYFMRYVYSTYNKKYQRHYASYENICIVRLGISLQTLLEKSNLSEIEENIKNDFYKFSPLIDSPSIMNKVCHYMENQMKELRSNTRNDNFDYSIYMNPEIRTDDEKLHKMSLLYDRWVSFQRNTHDKPVIMDENVENFLSKDDFIHTLENEAFSNISSNLAELTNLAVEVCYGFHPLASKEFAWKMFGGDGIIENLYERCAGFIRVPLLDKDGEWEYLGKRYKVTEVDLER